MTSAQTAMYFAEFGKLREVLRTRGWSPTKIEQHRHALTKKALGFDKSSKDFSNAELDRVLAVISAEAAPADFNAQMRLQDMPEKRFMLLLSRVRGLSKHVGLKPGLESAYVDGIARRMFQVQGYDKLTEQQLAVIEGVLRRRLRQLKLTVEQIAEIEREVADHAEEMTAIGSRAIPARPAPAATAAASDDGLPW